MLPGQERFWGDDSKGVPTAPGTHGYVSGGAIRRREIFVEAWNSYPGDGVTEAWDYSKESWADQRDPRGGQP
jgi:hypothetical protein